MIDALGTLSVTGSSARQAPVAGAAVADSGALTSSALTSATGGTYTQIRVDNFQNAVLIEERSSKTGEVVWQYPTEAQIEAFHQAQRLQTEAREEALSSPPSSGKARVAAPAVPTSAPAAPSIPAPSTPAPSAPVVTSGSSGEGGKTSVVV